MSERPDAYIQSAEDEWEEETSLEDGMNGVVGGDPNHLNWNYRAAILEGGGVQKKQVRLFGRCLCLDTRS
jgi:hypothetical protein